MNKNHLLHGYLHVGENFSCVARRSIVIKRLEERVVYASVITFTTTAKLEDKERVREVQTSYTLPKLDYDRLSRQDLQTGHAKSPRSADWRNET